MRDLDNYSLYRCPYSDIEKDCGHELRGPEGYQDVYSVWCSCGYRGPVLVLDPNKLGLSLIDTLEAPEPSEEMVSVPVEPTEDMLLAGCKKNITCAAPSDYAECKKIYKAMLAANKGSE